MSGYIHINAPQPNEVSIKWLTCADCQRYAPFTVLFTPYYGAELTCLRCGRRWSDGEWMALYFVRQSRQLSIAQAKKSWRRTYKNLRIQAILK